jgi:hypothetical protein
MATESFTNVNGTELFTHSASWQISNALTSDFVIDSNALRTPFNRGFTLAAYYAGTFSNDQYAEAKITQVGSATQRMGVAVRAGAGSAYVFLVGSGEWFLAKLVSFGYVGLTSGSLTLTANDVIRLEASGTTITAKQNGSTISTVTDASHASGNPGVCGDGSAASGTYTLLDDWVGDDLTAASLQLFQYDWPHQLHARR